MKDVVKTASQRTPQGPKEYRTGRKQGSIVGYCAIAFVFVSLIVLVLCLTVFFKIKQVRINGSTLYREQQILGVGGIVNEANLMRTDTKLIEKRLMESLVYIETAKVEKKYPSTLVVSVTEAQKAADIVADGKFCVVSKKGKILEMANPSATGGIPIIRGFELSSKKPGDMLKSSDSSKLRIYNQLMKILKSIGMDKITEIDLSSRSGIKILYDSRITLELGSSVDLDYKLNYFKSVIDSKLTDDFKGELVYNGADSGISAIPEGAGEKDDSATDLSEPDNVDAATGYGTDQNGGNNTDGTDDTNNIPTDPSDYGYMQNDNDQNNTGGYDYNTGGYDYNTGGYDYNTGGYDYNTGGYDYNTGGYAYGY